MPQSAQQGVHGGRPEQNLGDRYHLHPDMAGVVVFTVVLDLYARKLVDWSMKPTLAKELALDALLMAVWRRKPKHKVIIHSDQGSPIWQ